MPFAQESLGWTAAVSLLHNSVLSFRRGIGTALCTFYDLGMKFRSWIQNTFLGMNLLPTWAQKLL
jgi:hypothetical protein